MATGLVHQKPTEDPEDPVDPTYSFHICGIKFDDSNRNGVYDAEIEQGIDGVTVILLGPDQITRAEIYYSGKFTYPSPETNPLQTGENQLRGSYCFNLENVESGTYTFYVKIEEPSGRDATTPTLIGPITLVASAEGTREDLDNHFGNSQPIPPPSPKPSYPVGGVLRPINKLAILAPYLVLFMFLGVLSLVFAVRMKCKA